MNIRRYDPLRELMALQNTMDRMFDNTLSNPERNWNLMLSGTPALDVVETDDGFVVKASIPGVKPEDFEITFNNSLLTIKGEVQSEEKEDKGTYHLRERCYGSFSRSVSLPTAVNSDAVEATYENGVLTLNIPKAEEVKPKRIEIRAGKSKMIDAKK